MKTNEILKAIGCVKNKYTILHCTKLAAIYGLLKEIKNELVIAEITEKNIEINFAKVRSEVTFNREGIETTRTFNEGEKMIANKITVLTDRSEYSFAIPTNNQFYYAVCDILNPHYEVLGTEKIEAINTFEVSSEIIDCVKKAARFVSKDNLRPSMQCVCIDINNNELQVIATDCHRLYLSDKINVTRGEDMQLLLSPESIKAIAAMKIKNEMVKIEFLPVETVVTSISTEYDSQLKEYVEIESKQDNYYFLFNGLKCQYYQDMKFPDYKAVIPDYKSKMVFDRVKFIDNVKSVYPSSNKSTGQINFHLNGNIQIMAQDIDFNFECSKEMPYVNKDFKDTDIAFNGKFLIEGLNIFKAKEISMYSEGNNLRAAIFTDEVDTVLLMPLMMNNNNY